MRPSERDLVFAAALLTCATALVFSPDDYLPMLARAFLFQWVLAFAGLALLLFIRRARLPALAAALGGAMLSMGIDRPMPAPQGRGDGPSLRVMHMNVFQPNVRCEEVVGSILEGDADIVFIQELSPEWADALEAGLSAEYPYRHLEPRRDCYGMAVYSRVPFRSIRTWWVEEAPFIAAELTIDGTNVSLLSVHANSPTSWSDFHRRNRQLAAVAGYTASLGSQALVIGDLNTVPWDRNYLRLMSVGGLTPANDTAERTWPSLGPLALIPLDHLLVSQGIRASSFASFTIPGSDHRGIRATLIFSGHAS